MITCVTGPDGAGKTTFLRKLLAETTARRVGYMPQRFGLYESLSVAENLMLYADLQGVSRGERAARTERLLGATDLLRFASRPAGKLSGGMKQKLALVCALVGEPDTLILDEPTVGVDVVSRRELWHILKTFLRVHDVDVCVSTTYADEAAFCDKVIRLGGPSAPKPLPSRAAPPSYDGEGAAVVAQNLVKRFGAFTAVNGVSFRVAPGEIFGLLGANGAGKTTTFRMLCGLDAPTSGTVAITDECARRGIKIVDYHVHLRGGMTPEKAVAREQAWVVRSSAMDNHGREWETKTNEQLVRFAAQARAADAKLPVGIQVNDRDWFDQITPATRAKFDYILADTMIFGNDPDWKKNCLWNPQRIDDAEKWMDAYVEHHLRILSEPISILANPTYLPVELAGDYDRLWTEARMRRVISKAVARGIALEIQAESPYPRPKFLRLAKQMGAKFSFGTNNFDDRPKDLTHWLDVITWLDLHGSDIWTPQDLK